MARPESLAIGGYFPTPENLVPEIAKLIQTPKVVKTETRYAFIDPCAGDGAAVLSLISAMFDEDTIRAGAVAGYFCEMEETRADALMKSKGNVLAYTQHHVAKGDAFRLVWNKNRPYYSESPYKGGNVLYLNPPYDIDSVHGRMEERFLVRFTEALCEGGILLYVVPYYALKASATTLGKFFHKLHCFKFPGREFDNFRQVVLVGTKKTSLVSDPEVVKLVLDWAADSGSIPELGSQPGPVATLNPEEVGFGGWSIAPLDLTALTAKYRPWCATDRGGGFTPITSVLPTTPVADLLTRTYPMAMPPRAAHIAAGIAAGVFNGALIKPNDAESGLPDLLVKGAFDREFQVMDERTNKDGEVTGEIQHQQPRLVVTVLDLSAKAYYTMRSSAELTGAKEVSTMTTADLLDAYGRGLMRVMLEQCPVLHDPAREADRIELAPLARKLYQAQANAAMAGVKLLGGVDIPKGLRRNTKGEYRKNRSAYILGEIGSGKCLGIGTLVLRFDGTTVPVESVQTGDLLMGPDSQPRQVLGVTRGVGPLFKICPTIGDPWVCNDAHILTLVHTQSDDVFDIPLKELTGGPRIRRNLSKPYTWRKYDKTSWRTTHPVEEFKQFFPPDGVTFPQAIRPEVSPYFLGLWYGDGTKDLESVAVTTMDPEVVDALEAEAFQHGLTVRKGTNPRCPTYTLTQGRTGGAPNVLLDKIRQLFGDGARLPLSYLTGTRETRLAFLAGLLDSDGHYSNGVFDFIQKKKAWSNDVCFLARSLGFRATMSKALKSAYRGEPGEVYWRVCLSGALSEIPTRINRKRAHPRPALRRNVATLDSRGVRRMPHVNRTSIKISPIGEGEYAGFELDGDGRFLLGDFTVTHNTSVALAIAETIGVKRSLVMCPPHLLDGWKEQVEAVLPWAKTTVLATVEDVDTYIADKSEGHSIAIMSREAAKLGHAWESVGPHCPKCGAVVPPGDLAKTRATCEGTVRKPKDELARLAYRLALKLLPVSKDFAVGSVLSGGRHMDRMIGILKDRPRAWEPVRPTLAPLTTGLLVPGLSEDLTKVAIHLLLAVGDDVLLAETAKRIYTSTVDAEAYDYQAATTRQLARTLLLLMEPSAAQMDLADELEAIPINESRHSYYNSPTEGWNGWRIARKALVEGVPHGIWTYNKIERKDGVILFHEVAKGSLGSAEAALGGLSRLGAWKHTPTCGEPLYQAVAAPRRYPLATYIAKRAPKLLDLLILDEGQEYAGEGSAQGFAAHRLTGLGLPTLVLTGSVMNGYADSLFANQWAIDPVFRKEFGRNQRQEFVRRYGYLKQLVEQKDKDTGKVVAFGAMSDRVVQSARTIGIAPGVLPLFILRNLLRISVTLHKADLAIDLPKRYDIVERIKPNAEQKKALERLQTALVAQIKKDRFSPERAGKLWGQMAELPSFLDRATEDVGNGNGGEYVISYPEAVGGDVVVSMPLLPSNQLLPKEEWMLAKIKAELAEGRRVMVFTWHTALMPRLARLIEKHLDEKCPILDANKVAAGKRQAWINKEVIGKKRRVMIVNPVAVQTGLNNLVWFSTQLWMENPGCNAIVYRQGTGRCDRIGQRLEVRIIFPIYEGTTQEALHKLLLHKVGVSMATDGLSGEGALQAAGVGESGGLSTIAVGQFLWNLIQAA